MDMIVSESSKISYEQREIALGKLSSKSLHYDIRRTFPHFYLLDYKCPFFNTETLNSPGGGIIRNVMRSTLHTKFENFEKIKINSQNFGIKLTFEGGKVVACYL